MGLCSASTLWCVNVCVNRGMRVLGKALWGSVMVLEKRYVGAVHLPFTIGLHLKEQKCQKYVQFYGFYNVHSCKCCHAQYCVLF